MRTVNITRSIAVAIAVAALSVPTAAGADTRADRDEVRDRRDALDHTLDVLQASDAEVDAALDGIEASIASQRAAVRAAEDTAARAAEAERAAARDLRAAARDVEALEQAIAAMAVASYMHPPTADLVQSLQASSLSDAVVQQIYLDARANRDLDLLDLLERAQAVARERTESLALAAETAEAAVVEATAALGSLQTEQQRHVQLATDLQDRIDASLAEAAVLAELDTDLSEKIVAEQAALIERLPPPAPPAPPAPEPEPVTRAAPAPARPVETTVAPVVTRPRTDDDADDDETDEPTRPPVSAPAVTTPPTTTPPPPPRSTNAPPLRTVQGFTVHAAIADRVDAMLTAAADDGIRFGGSAYRSTERQIELRIAHCGPTYHDIWVRRASSCSPPTAVPGRSLHEQGRALDLVHEGRLITSRSNAGFAWLAANAADYGLYNLPSEPWHWSTTGG